MSICFLNFYKFFIGDNISVFIKWTTEWVLWVLPLHLDYKVPNSKTICLFLEKLVIADIYVWYVSGWFGITRNNETWGNRCRCNFGGCTWIKNKKATNNTIKNGETPVSWQENTSEAKHKLSQKGYKGTQKKGSETHYGYKNHAEADAETK